jgi:hypothetical protein
MKLYWSTALIVSVHLCSSLDAGVTRACLLTFLRDSWPVLIVSAHLSCDSAAAAFIGAHFALKEIMACIKLKGNEYKLINTQLSH